MEGKHLIMSADFRGPDREFGAVARFDKTKGRYSNELLVSILVAAVALLLYLAYDIITNPTNHLIDKVCGSGFFIGLAAVVILILWAGLQTLRRDEIIIYRRSIRQYHRGKLEYELLFGKDVTVSLSLDVDRIPQLKGYYFEDDKLRFEVGTSEGFNAIDIYRAWSPILEVVRANGMRTSDDFESYAKFREDGIPPPPKDPMDSLPPLTEEQTFKESVKMVEEEAHETRRAKEMVEAMVAEGTEPTKSIWSLEMKTRWMLTFVRAQLIAVLVIGAAINSAWDDGRGVDKVIMIITVAIVIEALFAWFLIRLNRRQRTFYEAQVGLERDNAFRSLMGVFKALDIDYTLSRDVSAMPSKTQWYDGQMVAIAFQLEGMPYTLEVLGYVGKDKALLLLSRVPEVENPALERLKGFISHALLEESGTWR